MFSITREIGIDAGHRIPLHHSKCCSVHGHRYTIQATCEGSLAREGSSTDMVLDFSFLKDVMINHIDLPCDHGLILSAEDPLINVILTPVQRDEMHRALNAAGYAQHVHVAPFGKLYVLPNAPTAEILAAHWYSRMASDVTQITRSRAKLTRVRVWETPNCFADFPT
jgi:6-pyruvoyltetrahydropterin/6-carboxytetrahydropterin synthase